MDVSRHLAVSLLGLIILGCGPGASEDEPEPEPGPDYAACQLNGDPGCVGTECAKDPGAVHWIELIELELAARGLSDRVLIRSAETYPDTNQVLVSVIVEIGWFRAWEPISNLRTNEGDAAFRADVGNWLDAKTFADAIVPHQDVLDAFADCHAELEYDPCEAHFGDLSVWDAVTYRPEPSCEEHLHTIRVDLVSGEVSCMLDQPPICG